MLIGEKYLEIIDKISKSKKLSNEELNYILKEKEMRYLVILFLRKYDYFNEEKIKEILNLKTRKGINYNCRKAEEKLLINKRFRDKYFELERKFETKI